MTREIRRWGEARGVRPLAKEGPVAIELDGVGLSVMMASGHDLEDFGVGYCLSDRAIGLAAEVAHIDVASVAEGHIIRLRRHVPDGESALAHVRPRTMDSACGLCGQESLERIHAPLPQVTAKSAASVEAIHAAAEALSAHQPMNQATGAMHAGALVGSDGKIRLVREDVGRHNAFDKLIGAMARQGLDWDDGFALLSSRCSYELMEKAALAGCPLLATVSAATTLAAARAAAAGLQLVSLVRHDSLIWHEGAA